LIEHTTQTIYIYSIAFLHTDVCTRYSQSTMYTQFMLRSTYNCL